jgi:hypothetical protein
MIQTSVRSVSPVHWWNTVSWRFDGVNGWSSVFVECRSPDKKIKEIWRIRFGPVAVRLVPNVVRARFSRYWTSLCHWSELYFTFYPPSTFFSDFWGVGGGVKPPKWGRTRLPPTREESCGFFLLFFSSPIFVVDFYFYLFPSLCTTTYIPDWNSIRRSSSFHPKNGVYTPIWLRGLCQLWTRTTMFIH